MNITTTYKTNSTGAGKIEARAGDRRKTSSYDHSLSADANHGVAAAAFIIAKAPDQIEAVVGMIDLGYAQHTGFGKGKHRFVL